MAIRTRLELRKLWRKFAKREQEDYVAQLRSARPKNRPDGRPTGGSLPVKAAGRAIIKIKRWGYILQWHHLGQKLTWFVRGTKGQPARPAKSTTDEESLIAELEQEIARQLDEVDRAAEREE